MKHIFCITVMLIGCSPRCPEPHELDAGSAWEPCPKLADEFEQCCASGAAEFSCDESTVCYCNGAQYSDGICPDWGDSLPFTWACE